MNRLRVLRTLTLLFVVAILGSIATAELTSDQRREIASLRKQVARVGGLIRQERIDDAQTVIDEAEKTIDGIIEASGIERNDRFLRSLLSDLERHKASLAKAMGDAPRNPDQIHFIEDVAPLIEAKCLNCHGADNPRAGLRLETLAGWRKGGRSGLLLRPGNAGGKSVDCATDGTRRKRTDAPTGRAVGS